MIMFIFLSSTYIYHLHPSYIFVLIFIVMVYACFLACYDYAVLALISFLPYAPITVEPICFERTFKIINIYHHLTNVEHLFPAGVSAAHHLFFNGAHAGGLLLLLPPFQLPSLRHCLLPSPGGERREP